MSYGARLTRSYSGVNAKLLLCASRRLWFTPAVTRVSPYSFLASLSEPCFAVVLVINGLEHRSPRTREKFGRFIYSDLVLEPWWTMPGPLTALPL